MAKRITDKKLPPILYKYRDWSIKNHRKLISKQEIYFSGPSDFNDPFDGNIPVRWDLMTYEECFEKNLEIINIAHGDKDQRLVREYTKKVTDEKTLWHPDNLKKERSEQLEKWNSIIGLFSLSSIPDNILMWSHYSYNHTGFAVGFDSNSLMVDYDFDYLESIVYQNDYPMITGNDDITTQFYKKFFHKSELWKYEKEWRISKNHINNRVEKLKPSTIKQVIIGCRTKPKDTDDIIKLIRKHLGYDVQIMKAMQNEDNFKLTIKPIE
jgi:hypothetical protein